MRNERINLMHGGGGAAMHSLLRDLLKEISKKKVPGGIGLDELDDAAVIPFKGSKLVYTTDTYTVEPLFFPGGDIGKLSMCGTVNDLAVMGAKPLAVSSAFTIGEGFLAADLKKIMRSMDKVSKGTGTPIVTGDTKVVEKDIGLFINTTGIGVASRPVRDSGMKPGDRIIINGSVGEHGIAVMAHRKGIDFETSLKSDCAPLWSLIEKTLRYEIHAMKDPTRGGIANALNEMASKSGVEITLEEEAIPVKEEVRAASEMLGIDPYTVANEGKVVMAVAGDDAKDILSLMKKHRHGKEAAIIGEVTKRKKDGRVILKTGIGGKRILETPAGDPIPRVC